MWFAVNEFTNIVQNIVNRVRCVMFCSNVSAIIHYTFCGAGESPAPQNVFISVLFLYLGECLAVVEDLYGFEYGGVLEVNELYVFHHAKHLVDDVRVY